MTRRHPEQAPTRRRERDRRCAFCWVDLATVARPVTTALEGVRYCSASCARGAAEYQTQLEAARGRRAH